MKDVLELAAFLALCFGIVFLFQGEPDLWDVLHARAMGTCKLEKP